MTAPPAVPSDERPDPQVRPARDIAPLHVDRSVLTEIAEYIGGDTSVERGGILVGDVDSTGTVSITGSIRAEHAESRPSSLTFTHETWDHVNEVLERDHAGHRIVGWYHSHPGFSVFLSEYDTFIHRNFFSAPWQVAYVIDPLIDEDGFFGWDGDDLVRYSEWRIRAVAGRAGAAITSPSPRRTEVGPSADSRPSRSIPLLAAIGIVPLLVGLAFGTMLWGDRPDAAITQTGTPVVRRDGLVVTRTLSHEDDCVVVDMFVTNPTLNDFEQVIAVDPVPSDLESAGGCTGGAAFGPLARFDLGRLDAGATSAISYSVRVPDGVVADTVALSAWAAEQRSRLLELAVMEPQPLTRSLTMTVGQVLPVSAYESYADGSLLPVGLDPMWQFVPEGVASVENGVVTAIGPGVAQLGERGGVPAVTVTVVPTSIQTDTRPDKSTGVPAPETTPDAASATAPDMTPNSTPVTVDGTPTTEGN